MGAIAIVGAACRFPQAANLREFWGLLTAGTVVTAPMPARRTALIGPSGREGNSPGGYVDDIEMFDADFFGISPREARAMDPRQRLALELTWQSLEDAGVTSDGLAAFEVAVYLGAMNDDYAILTQRNPAQTGHHTMAGISRGMIANRVSRFYGFRGPSMVVDSGQSSSLVAVHQACERLRSGESDFALAGAVHLNLSIETLNVETHFGALSTSGHSRPFDRRADGYVRGEGGAVVLLRRLEDAISAGDRIHAVISGTAVGNAGATGSALTVPASGAQADVVARACADGQIDPATVGYVECHGTATRVGDPIEAAALGVVFGDRRSPLLVGSVKGNIGHLGAASGMAGLLKTMLAVKNSVIPKSVNYAEPNPDIDFEAIGLRVNDAPCVWPVGVRRAGVSSFGMGGTNAHVVVEQAPVVGSGVGGVPGDLAAVVPWVLSAKTAAALSQQAGQLSEFVSGGDELSPVDVGWSLAHRTVFEHRAVVIGRAGDGLAAGLAGLARGEVADGIVVGRARPNVSTVFVFPGQGSHWLGMGAELREFSVFASAFDDVADVLNPHLTHRLQDVVRAGHELLATTEFAQPALFATEIALFRLFASWGIRPDYVMGHSVGEIAAACVSGVLSWREAGPLVAARGRLMQKLGTGGAMVAVEAAEEVVRDALFDGAEIAAVNTPGSVVISGPEDRVLASAARLSERGCRTRQLAVSHGFHSALMEPMMDEFAEIAAKMNTHRAKIPVVSTVTGGLAGPEFGSGRYWVDNVRRPVRFADAVRSIVSRGTEIFIEMGPPSGLSAAAERNRTAAVAVSVNTSPESLTHAAARLFCLGGGVDWSRVLEGASGSRIDLPGYPFQRQRYWLQAENAPTPDALDVPAVPTPAVGPTASQRSVVQERAGVERMVHAELIAVLGFAEEEQVDSRRAFHDLGLDSLAAIEFRDRVAARTGLILPPTLAFDHGSVDALSTYLAARLSGSGESQLSVPVTSDGSDDPIAVVAMACRYPGGVTTPDELWDLVIQGRDAISTFPHDRGWDLPSLHRGGGSGRPIPRCGGFLADIAGFDAGFFGIGPREAAAMDPQQRLLLELSWEAIERAGIDPVSLRGSETGVFAGLMHGDYARDAPAAEGYWLTGQSSSVASGRVAYALGLSGPAVSVDTACSSSLVALHLAIQSLRRGECNLALAAGITVMSTPRIIADFNRQSALAADGRCKPFSAAADGVVWAEGAGILLLGRLSDATRRGLPVLAVVRGSAVNQDGASNGLTAPSGIAQQRVLWAALADARLSASGVDVVEAHGTGTPLGDPIEANALIEAYGRDRDPDRPLWIGSIKSNIGHTQAAAGMAGVIKMIQAMRHGILPATLNADQRTPHVDWSAGAVEVLVQARPWPVGVRRAGVSSFGMGGTNAHVVVEQAPVVGSGVDGVPGDLAAVVPWVLSAKTAAALSQQAGQLSEFVSGGDELSPVDVGWSLAHRTVFEHRAVVIGRAGDGLAAGLAGLARGEVADGIVVGRARPNVSTVFVFPGQGSHWLGMGAELFESAPVFADCIRRCDSALREFTHWSLIEVIRGAPGSPRLDRVDVVQPALWAVMVSLAELWRSYGVQPDAVIGHSQGEIAAACVAGGLSLRDGARIIAVRSRLLKQLSGLGGMVWVGCSESVVRDLILRLVAKIDIAAVNSSVSVVVSGDPAALEDLLRYCESVNIRARRIDVDYASHSDQVCDVRADLLTALASIEPMTGSVPFISSATGEVINTSGLDAGYWYESLRGPVKFGQALETALAQEYLAFVECSPHSVLLADAEQIVADSRGSLDDGIFVPSLGRGDGGLDRFLRSVGQAFTAGIQVDWKSAFDRYCVRWVELPTYPFQHRRFWITPSNGFPTDPDGIGQSRIDHPFLGSMIERPDSTDVVLTGLLSLRRAPWLADHRINGNVIFPGAGFVEMAARAAHVVGCGGIGDVTIIKPLQISDGADVQVQVVVDAHLATGDRPLRIYSRAAGKASNWTLHVEGWAGANNQEMDAALQIPGEAEVVDLTDLYQTLYDRGYQYGPAFQALNAMWRYGDDYFAEIALPQGVAPTERGFGVHPIILDAALHVMLIHRCADSVELPFAWEGVTVRDSVATTLIARISPLPGGAVSIELADVSGQSVLSIRSVRMRALPSGQPGTEVARSADLRRLSWEPVGEIPSTASAFGVPMVYEAYGARECENLVSSVYELSERGLHHLQEHLRQANSGTLMVVTRGAVALPGERVEDLAGAALWGLIRSAQAEHPGAVILVDIDSDSELVPATIAATGEPQVVVRSGGYHTPKLVPVVGEQELPPPGDSWRMRFDGSGVLGKTHFERDSPDGRLLPGQVRVEIHAVGVNFRDVLVSLGMYPDPGVVPGAEAAGLVVEVAPDVTGLAPGDAVMGLIVGIGPVLVADHRLLARIPHGWSMAKAASVPVVFLTAYYALADVIEIERGESVLIHAATGGVGMAALQLARHWGADVFVTAHRSKWELLRSMGFDDSRIGDSRSPEFVTSFRSQTGQRGLDAVLNSLAGEFVDASLDTLREGGRFVEMGKTDIRDTGWLSQKYPGTRYQAIDLFDTPFERIAQMWNELVPMFESGALAPLPRRTWDLRDATEAYRFVGRARHVGKVVLHLPAALRSGTVLISGGTGMAGAAVARHLVNHHGVRRLLLLSRRGMLADDARSLVTELTGLGAAVDVMSCDIADHEALQQILDSYKRDHLLSGVVHAAGLLDDATVERMSPEQLRRVLEVKVAGAWNLHDLTADLDLAAFVLFSSVVGTLGLAGQANYAAANAFLDALVERRRFDRLPGISLAWGVWNEPSAMTGHLDDRNAARLRRAGLIPMPTDEALRLFDTAIEGHSGVLVASSFDPAKADAFTKRLSGESCAPPPQYLDMATGGGVHEQAWMSGTGAADRQAALFDLVCTQVAAVLGYEDPATLEPGMAFRDLGFDSLSAVELRNRLRMATGVTLSATVAFDHPTPEALTRYLAAELQTDVEPVVSGDRLGKAIAGVERLLTEGTWTPEQLSEAVSRLRSLVSGVVGPSGNVGGYADIEDASDSELFAMLDEQLGG